LFCFERQVQLLKQTYFQLYYLDQDKNRKYPELVLVGVEEQIVKDSSSKSNALVSLSNYRPEILLEIADWSYKYDRNSVYYYNSALINLDLLVSIIS